MSKRKRTGGIAATLSIPVSNIETLPVTALFVDAVNERISTTAAALSGITAVKHAGGYQRDPRERLDWLRRDAWNEALARPLEVSQRDTTPVTYAIMDGGGSWVKRLMNGISMAPCRVHTGLSRAEEAALFDQFDRKRKRLSKVHQFLAQAASGAKTPNAIIAALAPNFVVANRGVSALGSVGALESIYDQAGAAVLQKAAQLAGNVWGPTKGLGLTHKGHTVPGNVFVAVAVFVEITRRLDCDEAKMRKVMDRRPPKTLLKAARDRAGTATKTPQMTRFMVEVLVEAYNSHLGKAYDRITQDHIRGSAILKKYAKAVP